MSVDPNWHHAIAVEGVGYNNHQMLAMMGDDWWSMTIEVIDQPPSKAASAASIYSQSYDKYKNLSKPNTEEIVTQIVRVTIRFKGEIVSQRDYVKTTGRLIIRVAPLLQKSFNVMVRFKDSIKDKLKFKVKPK